MLGPPPKSIRWGNPLFDAGRRAHRPSSLQAKFLQTRSVAGVLMVQPSAMDELDSDTVSFGAPLAKLDGDPS